MAGDGAYGRRLGILPGTGQFIVEDGKLLIAEGGKPLITEGGKPPT